MYIVFTLNIILTMYPAQLAGADVIADIALMAVRYINPAILAIALVFFFWKRFELKNRGYIFSALVASMVMAFSSVYAESSKSFFTALFFFIAALTLMLVARINSDKFQEIFKSFLLVWVVAPVVLLVNPDWWSLFVSFPEKSFHGFADSRIMYGFWGSVAAIIVFTKSYAYGRWHKIIAFLVFLGVYMSQSRAAVVALAVTGIYFIFLLDKVIEKKIILFFGIAVLVALVFLSWKLYGRQESFEMVNSTRQEIAEKYIDNINNAQSLFGAGRQVNVVIGGVEVQAHNFIIQWIANWGYIGMLSLLIYINALWKFFESRVSRMLLLVFFVFSLTQPIQGTANFFGPVTLSFLLFAAMMESKSRGEDGIDLISKVVTV